MNKISFWKKIKLFLIYRRIVKKNINELYKEGYRIRVDDIYRLYTVVNLPDDVKDYGSELTQKYLTDYINKVDNLFLKLGISEYVGIGDIRKENELSYVVIFNFKFFDTAEYANKILNIFKILVLLLIGLGIYKLF